MGTLVLRDRTPVAYIGLQVPGMLPALSVRVMKEPKEGICRLQPSVEYKT